MVTPSSDSLNENQEDEITPLPIGEPLCFIPTLIPTFETRFPPPCPVMTNCGSTFWRDLPSEPEVTITVAGNRNLQIEVPLDEKLS